MKRLLLFLFVGVVIVLILEVGGYCGLLRLDKNDPYNMIFPNRYIRLRNVLAKQKGALPRYVGAVNINFMPTPGYTLNGEVQHNEDGYRGTKVELQKTDKYRILFLGGSTTYSSGVKHSSEAYPAQTLKWLNELTKNQQLKFKNHNGFEVINAGLEGGHSNDELNLYLHKFRYYKPDLIVLHSGGNDAEVDLKRPSFTPDDFNFRKPEMYQIYRYPIPAIFFRSNFFSFIVIRYFLQSSFNHDQPQLQSKLDVVCNWYDDKAKADIFANDYNTSPFCRNVQTLIREAQNDSAKVMLLPFALNMKDAAAAERPNYVQMVNIYNRKLREIATNMHASWCNYSYNDIKPKSWFDDCHLDADGEAQKGKLVAIAIIDYLEAEQLIHPKKSN